MKYKILVLVFSVLVLALFSNAEPMTFKINPTGDNLVRFESKAPLETIIGTTDQISGSITCDPDNLYDGVSADIKVDAASIKTGNKIRDGHMRVNHLNTEEHPTIEFKMDDVELDGHLMVGIPLKTTATGDFSLHGITRTIDVPAEVTLMRNDNGYAIHVVAEFQVELSDYEIPRPQFLIMKLDEVQNITVNFRGVTQ